MEILSSSTVPCRFVVSLRSILAENASSSCLLKLPASRERKMLVTRTGHSSGSLRLSGFDKLFFKNLNLEESLRSADAHGGLRNGDSKVFSGNYSTYAVGGEEAVGSITENGESLNKVLISELPDESNGEHSAPISSCFWEWKPKLHVHYEKAGCENVKSPSVLFLPGFGVGSFHYEKQLKDLGRDYRVWAIDFLGQGMSLPVENPTLLSREGVTPEGRKNSIWGFGDEIEPWANELVFSMDLWRDQVQYFVEEVIGEPVYVIGNSLGGFVALYFAATNPQLVKGITLLNATPFWGFLPNPIRSPRLAKIFPWSGTFPLPANVRKLTEFFWQKISDPKSIAEILKQVYTDHSTNIDKVFSRIIEITQHPAAAASFASIMFAPQGQLSFRETLARCKMSNIPICLVYGKEDPWVKPVWGLQVKQQVPEAPYYEVSPAGHCPHDEVPEVVNYLLRGWIKNLESRGSVALPLIDDTEVVQNSIAWDLEFAREGSKKSDPGRFRNITTGLFVNQSISSDQMTRLLSKTFRSIKLKASSSKPPPPPQPQPQPQQPSSSSSLPRTRKTQAKSRSWSVYLILSTNHPIKTYVGVTTNFSRRLKQHNGELKGGAKASRAGRPWICACLIHGFIDWSEACEFESKWKSFSRKLPRKRIDDDQMKQSSKDSHRLLHHRKTALDRVKGSNDLSHLEIDWKLNTF